VDDLRDGLGTKLSLLFSYAPSSTATLDCDHAVESISAFNKTTGTILSGQS
jgi:hypothetical protein